MAKLNKDEYWAILDKYGKFVIAGGDSPIITKTRGELLDFARHLYDDNETQQMISNGQTQCAFPRITKIKLTYQVI